MSTIINSKPDPSVVRETVCKNCGVKVSFLHKDIVSENHRDYSGCTDTYYHIVCPGCQQRIDVPQYDTIEPDLTDGLKRQIDLYQQWMDERDDMLRLLHATRRNFISELESVLVKWDTERTATTDVVKSLQDILKKYKP